jgi:hypothetical protein
VIRLTVELVALMTLLVADHSARVLPAPAKQTMATAVACGAGGALAALTALAILAGAGTP